jgi:hypothetical protein
MAIQLGSVESLLFQSDIGRFGTVFEDPALFYQLVSGTLADDEIPPATLAGDELAFLKQISSTSIQYSTVIRDGALKGVNTVSYPATNLAKQLGIVAKLISGGLETPVYLCTIGGFDTHANQLTQHANLWKQISDAVAAFQKDLKTQYKADKVTSQQLMRVYGALMWSLGKVVQTPEVMRVYIGSFWDGECMNPDMAPFFRAEQADLLQDLHELPRYAAVRKINELVKRARMSRVHALIIGHLKAQMPFFGQAAAQKKMIDNMAEEFYAVMKKHRLPQGDFPNIARVATDGTVTALAAGTAIIFATSEGRIATATISVTALTARTVTVAPATGRTSSKSGTSHSSGRVVS